MAKRHRSTGRGRGWVTEAIARVGRDDAILLVAESDGDVVGFVSVTEREHWSGDRDAEIGELVVRADAEGDGVGSALVAAARRWAREAGFGVLTLATGAENTRARGFYGRLGFIEEDVRLALLLRPGWSGGVAESDGGAVVDDVEVTGG